MAVAVKAVFNSEVNLNGVLTTPVKGAADASAFTGTNISAAVTVSPADGYIFGDGASVAFDQLSFTKNTAGNFVASKPLSRPQTRP